MYVFIVRVHVRVCVCVHSVKTRLKRIFAHLWQQQQQERWERNIATFPLLASLHYR